MDADSWNNLIQSLPGTHILQTWQWGLIKNSIGWTMIPQIWRDDAGTVKAAAMVLERTIQPGGFAAALRILYIPRGPLLDWQDVNWRRKVLKDLQNLARKRAAIFIKIDPEVIVGTGIPGSESACEEKTGEDVKMDFLSGGWRFSEEQIQFRNTVMLNLASPSDDWLARMKPKTRYNLRLAERKGVRIRLANPDEYTLLYRMYMETSVRDGFVIRPQAYYELVWNTFIHAGLAEALVAEVDGEPIAGLVWFHFARRAYYLFGMSRGEHREKMPNYLLQWEAMQHACAAGCIQYDLWGTPDQFIESDPMWGVYRFKEGMGGQVVRTIGAWDYPSRPWLYSLYSQILPRILAMMRLRGKQETKREVAP